MPAVLGHVASAVLLRQVCRRLGARGWIATAAALAFLYFGAGNENIFLGFQLALTGSLICGFGMFLLAEGPAAVTRRDWLTLALGVVGLMTSGAFVAIVVGVSVTTLLRRGLRVAAFYAVPLASVYLAWYAVYGRDSAFDARLTGQAVRYFRRLLWSAFDALAQGWVGALLVVLATVGLAAAVRRAWLSRTWPKAALAVGLGTAWLTFAGVTAVTREQLAAFPIGGRLLHVGAVLVLPLIAAGAEELARRGPVLGIAALVPLAVGVPGNLDQLPDTPIVARTDPELAYAIAHSPFVDDVPRSIRPMQDSGFQPPATAGWLADQAAAGRIPEPDEPVPPELELTATSRLVLARAVAAPGEPNCPALTAPLQLTLREGDEIGFLGAVQVTVTDGGHRSVPRRFGALERSLIRVQAGPVDVLVQGVPDIQAQVCPPVS